MKRCPECRRDYYDDTLSFCLSDGTELVYGLVDEPPTAILSEPGAIATGLLGGEDQTRPQINTTDQTAILHTGGEAEPQKGLGGLSEKQSFSAHRAAKPLIVVGLVVVLAIGGFFGYRYFGSSTNDKRIESIAVMPFVNEGGNADVEYLSDGVTESLINSLSTLPGLKVISRASIFRYKGEELDVDRAAKDLNVRAVMTGRIVQRGDTIDVSVNLTDTQNNSQLWGQHFVRKAADIFAVQDEIAKQVTDALRFRLSGEQEQQVTKRYTQNAEAYRLFMQGRYSMYDDATEDGRTRAVSFFDKAIELDPQYALAYAARAETIFSMGDLTMPMSEAKPKVEQDVATALRIDKDLVEAVTIRANLEFQYDWDFVRAEQDFKRAIALNPNYAEAHHQYAWYLSLTGKPADGLGEIKLAQQLDPVNPTIIVDLGLPYYFQRQYDQSIALARDAASLFPDFFLPHKAMGEGMVDKGDFAAGIAELEKAKTMEPTPIVTGALGYSYAKAGRKGDARKILADLKEQSKTRYVAAYWIALIYVGLDEKDEAFPWLEKAYQDRSWWLLWAKMDPKLDSLRSDPRFKDLLKRINLPE